ncbi:DNA/RNA helicase [Virgibacillus indicus]|uniref:DNA/RNA helicase n=1 Tax=Virgibacillus indicus TaxID=2024554 RepID=A0A265NAI9_9BACI|nr:DEAD/DEAH box helicase family protein [Virgibacillus indicus]OZU88805.1 DNA/RNA helicase [Virgibacillus indicus]
MQPKKAPPDFTNQQLAKRFSGKLLLRNEIPLNEALFQKLCSANLFTPSKSIKRKKLSNQCQRCNNQKQSLFAAIPCQSCKKTHLYCRNCIEMGRVMECEALYLWSGEAPIWPSLEDPCSWIGKLTNVQQQAANRIVNAIRNKEKELLIWAVCGAGKTEMLYPGISEALMQGKRICIATPRADVVRELLPRIKSAFSSTEVAALYGGSPDKDATAQIIISTTHQLLRYKEAFDVLIIDEIDAFPYHADQSLPFAANRSKASSNTTIYLTATPRSEHQKQIRQKKLPHIFVPVRFHGKPLPVPLFKMCFDLRKELKSYKPPTAFLKWLDHRKNPKRRLLVFVPTIKLADKMKDNLTQILIDKQILSSNDSLCAVHATDPDRKEKVELFREKKIEVLLTTTILERGVTFPSVDVAVLDAGHIVFDEAALVQISGRAGRSPDDPTGEVLFFHDGKTDAMVEAKNSIISMNKRGGFS